MESTTINKFLYEIEVKEKRAKKRAIAFTFIPVVTAILLIAYTSNKILKAESELNLIEKRINEATKKVKDAQTELKKVKDLNNELFNQNKILNTNNDSLSNSLTESVVTLGKAVSVTAEFKKFIDKMEPYLRSQGEASFYINFKMLEDKIRGNYETLSKTVSELPKLDEKKNWIVIVESSTSLQDLQREVSSLAKIYGTKQLAIYQDSKGYFALSIIGNGTFTRAYRLNVELRDKYGYSGAYFSGSPDWGIDYLKMD